MKPTDFTNKILHHLNKKLNKCQDITSIICDINGNVKNGPQYLQAYSNPYKRAVIISIGHDQIIIDTSQIPLSDPDCIKKAITATLENIERTPVSSLETQSPQENQQN
jgi:hypothetical protein